MLAFAIAAPLSATAQQPEDPLVRRGTLRLEIAPSYGWWDHRFGERTEDGVLIKETEPLGFDLTRDDVGATMIPSLEPFRARVADLLRDEDFELDLGKTRTSWTYGQSRIPIRVDVGITDWLTVSGMIPMVRTESLVDVSFQGDSTTANAGTNPSQSDPTSVNTFLTALDQDLANFTATVGALCGDLGDESPECLEARSLLDEGMSLDQGLSDLYGDGSAFFPLTGTDAGRGVEQRVDAFRSGLESYGQTPGFGSAPLSDAPVDAGGFSDIVTQAPYGVGAAPLGPLVGSWGLGDAELSVAARLLSNATGGDEPAPNLQYLLGGQATLRLATGATADPDVIQSLDVGGTGALRLRVFGSAQAGRRWGLWGHLAVGLAQPTTLVRRVATPDVVLAPAASRALVEWQPGNTMDLYLAPRFLLAPGLTLTLPYQFQSKGSDAYSMAPQDGESPSASNDVSVLNEETSASIHRLGLGVIYSTLPAFRRDESSFPMELRATWQTSIAGGGGQTPSHHTVTFTFRLFLSFWGDGA